MGDAGAELIARGYDAVYGGIQSSPALQAVWRVHAMGADFPAGFEHISFFNTAELASFRRELPLAPSARLADLACGLGGPGLLVARETGAALHGIDISPVGVEGARRRAERVGLAGRATFRMGTFAATGLDDASMDGAMTLDALQYAPDKRAALSEVARILRPGGRFVFTCFELEPAHVAGLPVLGDDPVSDYAPLLDEAGLDVLSYVETPDWRARVERTYQAVLDAKASIAAEAGEQAMAALEGEIALTLAVKPYRRRVFASARKR